MTVLEMTEAGQYEDPWDTVPVIGAGMPVERPTGLVGGSTAPVLDDLAVVCDITGTPCVVTYCGEEHRVLQPAVRWYERRNWWDVEVRVPREVPEAVRDKDHRAPRTHAAEALEELELAQRVHGAARLIDDDEPRLGVHEAHERACPVPLSAMQAEQQR